MSLSRLFITCAERIVSTGKEQIIATILFTELITEIQGDHYTKGGATPGVVFPPLDFSKCPEDVLARRQSAELNNGRLAMIAIISFVCAANVPGSVPLLADSPMY